MGAFGLWEPPCEKTPPGRLTSSHAVIDAFEVYRQGITVEGSSAVLQTPHGPPEGYRLGLCTPGILEINGAPVRLVSHKCLPAPVFQCPVCSKDVYRLYDVGGWRCRRCGNLTYESKCRHRSVPGLSRIVYLRRRLHADPTPFTPLPKKRPGAWKHFALCREVRRLEAALIAHARDDVAVVLEKRYARRFGR